MNAPDRQRQIEETILQRDFVCPFAAGEARSGRLQYTHLSNSAHFSTTGREIEAGLEQFAERNEGAWIITADVEPPEHRGLQQLLRHFQAHVLAVVAKPAFDPTAEPLDTSTMHGKLTGLSGVPPAYLNRFAKSQTAEAPGYTRIFRAAQQVQARVQAISTEVRNQKIFMIGMGPTYVWPESLRAYAPPEVARHPRFLPVSAMVVTWIRDIEQGMMSGLQAETTRRMAAHPYRYNPTLLAPDVAPKTLIHWTPERMRRFLGFCEIAVSSHPQSAEIQRRALFIPHPPFVSSSEYLDAMLMLFAEYDIYFNPQA